MRFFNLVNQKLIRRTLGGPLVLLLTWGLSRTLIADLGIDGDVPLQVTLQGLAILILIGWMGAIGSAANAERRMPSVALQYEG